MQHGILEKSQLIVEALTGSSDTDDLGRCLDRTLVTLWLIIIRHCCAHIFADLSTPQQPVSGCCTQKKLLVPNQARTNRRGLCVFMSLMLGAQSQVKLLMGSCITTLLPVLTFNQAEYTSVYVNNGIYVLCLCGIGGNRDFVMQPCFVA